MHKLYFFVKIKYRISQIAVSSTQSSASKEVVSKRLLVFGR
jgi:hypothetical protein